jgi:hypothetical protein
MLVPLAGEIGMRQPVNVADTTSVMLRAATAKTNGSSARADEHGSIRRQAFLPHRASATFFRKTS